MNTLLADPGIEIFRAMVARSPEAMMLVDERGIIAFENLKAQRLVGWTSGLGRSLLDVIHPNDVSRASESLSHVFAHGEPDGDLTYRIRHAEGHWISVRSACHIVDTDQKPFAAVHSTDISDYHHLETRLRHAQKLITLGRLALAMANDFDEALASIRLQLASLIQDRIEEPSRFAVRAVQRALSDATALVSQLRVFAHTAPMFVERVEVNMLLRDLRRLLSDHIWLSVSTGAPRSEVLADRNGLREALTDLAICFGNAMPPNSVVSIETANLPATDGSRRVGSPAADHLIIEVTNTASRADEPPDDSYIFEASAVKPASGPIMLALVVLHDVVTYAGGFIEIAAQDRMATKVRIFLPLQ
jgi:two-component system cell cycle sensor histidine kinase/response regulator CckA